MSLRLPPAALLSPPPHVPAADSGASPAEARALIARQPSRPAVSPAIRSRPQRYAVSADGVCCRPLNADWRGWCCGCRPAACCHPSHSPTVATAHYTKAAAPLHACRPAASLRPPHAISADKLVCGWSLSAGTRAAASCRPAASLRPSHSLNMATIHHST